jgi:hypothetical protein
MEPLAFRAPANDKITSTTAMHIMREAEEVERLWTTQAIALAVPWRGTTKPNEPSLGGFYFQRKVSQAVSKFTEKSPGVLVGLETGNEI